MSKIQRHLPNDKFEAALNATGANGANPFATLVDLESVGGSADNRVYVNTITGSNSEGDGTFAKPYKDPVHAALNTEVSFTITGDLAANSGVITNISNEDQAKLKSGMYLVHSEFDFNTVVELLPAANVAVASKDAGATVVGATITVYNPKILEINGPFILTDNLLYEGLYPIAHDNVVMYTADTVLDKTGDWIIPYRARFEGTIHLLNAGAKFLDDSNAINTGSMNVDIKFNHITSEGTGYVIEQRKGNTSGEHYYNIQGNIETAGYGVYMQSDGWGNYTGVVKAELGAIVYFNHTNGGNLTGYFDSPLIGLGTVGKGTVDGYVRGTVSLNGTICNASVANTGASIIRTGVGDLTFLSGITGGSLEIIGSNYSDPIEIGNIYNTTVTTSGTGATVRIGGLRDGNQTFSTGNIILDLGTGSEYYATAANINVTGTAVLYLDGLTRTYGANNVYVYDGGRVISKGRVYSYVQIGNNGQFDNHGLVQGYVQITGGNLRNFGNIYGDSGTKAIDQSGGEIDDYGNIENNAVELDRPVIQKSGGVYRKLSGTLKCANGEHPIKITSNTGTAQDISITSCLVLGYTGDMEAAFDISGSTYAPNYTNLGILQQE